MISIKYFGWIYILIHMVAHEIDPEIERGKCVPTSNEEYSTFPKAVGVEPHNQV